MIEQHDTHESKTARQVREQAAEWTIKKADHPEWSEDDQSNLDGWLAESASNAVAFLRVENAWERMDRLKALRQPSKQKRKVGPLLKMAAAISAVVVIGAILLQTQSEPRVATFATNVGGHEVLKLADGSRIELNTSTKLRTLLSGATRTVWLDEGEAYFQVKHDVSRPFIVYAAGHRLTDIGTRFLVKSAARRVQVTLIDGEVRFESSDAGIHEHSALMTAGDVVVATADSMSVARQPISKLENQLGWRRGILVFKHTTLGDAVEQFNRYNVHKIAIADPRVANLTIDGTFGTTNTRHFAEVVQAVFGLQVHSKGMTTVISR